MITLDININNEIKSIKIKDDVLFNALLIEHPSSIKKIINAITYNYKISDDFFEILNKFIDITEDGVSLYPGLIVRTGLYDYAILYLESAKIDEEYMLKIINEYIYDVGDHNYKTININKFEVDKITFLEVNKDF